MGAGWDAGAAYDRMAAARARALGAPWPAVAWFLRSLPRGARVLDVGVGNGRYAQLEEARGLQWVGLDLSREQLRLAKEAVPAGALLLRADARSIPLRPAAADAAVAVAVIHHLPSRGDRVAAMGEVARCLRPGAPCLISAWDREAAAVRMSRRAPGGGPGDVMIAFQQGVDAPVDRFFHLYGPGELAGEAAEAGLHDVEESLEAENRFATGRAPGAD